MIAGKIKVLPSPKKISRRACTNARGRRHVRVLQSERRWSILLVLCAVLCFVFVAAPPAHSHKVNVFAYVEGSRICVEGYFGGNSKAKHCVVEVLNSGGTVVAKGETDDKGLFSFDLSGIPRDRGDLTVVLHAGSGHKATYTLRANELPTTVSVASEAGRERAAAAKEPSGVTKSAQESTAEQVSTEAVMTDEARVRRIVEEAVGAKIQPLVKMLGNQQRMLLEEQRRGPTIQEIVGGIGWILGIVGVAAYVMSRNRGGRG